MSGKYRLVSAGALPMSRYTRVGELAEPDRRVGGRMCRTGTVGSSTSRPVGSLDRVTAQVGQDRRLTNTEGQNLPRRDTPNTNQYDLLSGYAGCDTPSKGGHR